MNESMPQPGHAASQGAPRIHLDQDASGAFLYRLVDVATGRVLAELPRERVRDLTASAADLAGTPALAPA